MKLWSVAAVIALAYTAPACLAANARNPYGNIDPSNDAGNDTGDLQVEALNQAQIDDGPVPVIRHAQTYPRYAPGDDAYGQQETAAPDAYAPPDGYYPATTYAPPAQPYPYQPARPFAPPGYAPYPPVGYAPRVYGPGPYASGYAPRGYYAPPAYYPPPGYAPPGY